MTQQRAEPTLAELFTPKLVTMLREGYRLGDLRADAVAGLTVAIVALPLSMAIAVAIGLLRLGTFIRYIPFPVTVGFTAGIAVVIFASQLKDLLGLTLAREPGPLIPTLAALGEALPSLSIAAAVLSAATIGLVAAVRRWRPHWPAMLIAVALAAVAAWLLGLPAETIGTRFGGIPSSLPAPHLPVLSADRITAVLPAALSFALLGSIESLLSAMVADSMSGRRHRSNCELVAQGRANIAATLFGGFCVTGTIARTATNVRAGARGPVSDMLHAAFLPLFMLVAAPLASFIPLAAVLAVVAWNVEERHQFATLLWASRGDAAVLLATFGLVLFRDLTEGILVGFSIGALLFLHPMAQAVGVESTGPEEDRADAGGRPYDVATARRRGAVVTIAGAQPTIRRALLIHGVRPPQVRFRTAMAGAVADARSRAGAPPPPVLIGK